MEPSKPPVRTGLTNMADYLARIAAMDAAERESRLRIPAFVVGVTAPADFEDVALTRVTTTPPIRLLEVGAHTHELLVLPIEPGLLNSNPERLTLGRAPVCDLVLPQESVSKVHAYLHHVRPEVCEIEDAGSTNGTTVNGVRLRPKQQHPLVDGTQVAVGDVTLEFRSASKLAAILFPDRQPR